MGEKEKSGERMKRGVQKIEEQMKTRERRIKLKI